MSAASGGAPAPVPAPVPVSVDLQALERVQDSLNALVEKLRSNMSNAGEPDREYFPSGTAWDVWRNNISKLRRIFRVLYDIEHDEETLLHQLVGRTLGLFGQPRLCSITAILFRLLINREHLASSVQVFLPRSMHDDLAYTDDKVPITDDALPITNVEACRLLGPQVGDAFFKDQFLFCPIVLKEHEEAVYVEHKKFCRLPYKSDEEIARGSFGIVYKVRIEKGHVKTTGGMALEEDKDYARKDFTIKGGESFTEERKTLRQILRASRTHENIMVTLGSLQRGEIYSLFFELAEENLWEYLTRNNAPQTKTAKMQIFHHATGLAGALAHLHGLDDADTYEPLCCYHLDLKPQNILVVRRDDGSYIWKISDFGMSRVKRLTGTYDMDQIFEQTMNRRGDGTYLAPEAALDEPVGRQADVWSFGCVLSLVMTFIDDGKNGVEEFGRSRGRTDQFYKVSDIATTDTTASVWPAPCGKEVIVNPQVLEWFNMLQSRAREDSTEERVFSETLHFLSDRVLLPDPSIRGDTTAKEIREELKKIYNIFRSAPGGTGLVPQSPGRIDGASSTPITLPGTPLANKFPNTTIQNRSLDRSTEETTVMLRKTSTILQPQEDAVSAPQIPRHIDNRPSNITSIPRTPPISSSSNTTTFSNPNLGSPAPSNTIQPSQGNDISPPGTAGRSRSPHTAPFLEAQSVDVDGNASPGSILSYTAPPNPTHRPRHSPSPSDVDNMFTFSGSAPDNASDPAETGTAAIPRRASFFTRLASPIHKIRRRSSSRTSQTFQLQLSGDMNKCAFTAQGDRLAFYSPEAIEVYSVDGMRSKDSSPQRIGRYEVPDGGRWAGFCLNSDYLCAYPSSTNFECYIYNLSTCSALDGAEVTPCRNIYVPWPSGPIKKMAISPNAEFIACAIDRSGDTLGKSYNCGHIDENKRDLKFSTDSQLLAFIGRSKLEAGKRLTVTVHAWSTSKGVYLSDKSFIDRGRNDLTTSLLTSLALFHKKHSFLAILHQKQVRYSSFMEETDIFRCSDLGLSLSDVLIRGDDLEAAFITTKRKVVTVPISHLRSQEKVQPIQRADLASTGYNYVTDCAFLFEDPDQKKRGILVASCKGKGAFHEIHFEST
ncbi:MAG: hypothetical protein M1819_001484 [Sarea resinae]|nr:MAG: hypothetical protein M1819_001484 [Sarea resinae]